MPRSCLLAFVLLATAGCHCSDRRIDVSLPATLQAGTSSSNVTFAGTVSEDNIGGSFDLLERVVRDTTQSSEAHTIVWTMTETGAGAPGFLSVSLRVPVRVGDSVAVSLGGRGGGWGVLSGDTRTSPLSATVYLERGAFVPTIARGALTVRRTSPLQTEVDITFFSASSETLRLQGTLTFDVSEESGPCFE